MANIILTEKIYASANFKTTVTNFAAYMLHQYIRTNRKELKIQQIGERVYYDDGQVVEKTLSRAITFSIPRENFAFSADRKLMVYEVVDKLPDEKAFFTIQLVGVGASGLFLPIMPSLLANAAKRRLRYWSSDVRIDICFQHFYSNGSFVLNSECISLFDAEQHIYTAAEAHVSVHPRFCDKVKEVAARGCEHFLISETNRHPTPLEGKFYLLPRSTYEAWAKHAVKSGTLWDRLWR